MKRALKEHCWFERDLILYKNFVYELPQHYATKRYAMYSVRLVIPKS